MTWDDLQEALLGRGLIQPERLVTACRRASAVTGIAYDSRAVEPGQVFVALKGLHADGAAFVRQAVERGAARRRIGAPGAARRSAWRGRRSPTRGWRSRFWRRRSTGIRATRCR